MLLPGSRTRIAFAVLLTTVSARGGQDEVDFGRDVRPLLADRCFACHGPDANTRKADLRLDQEGSARRVLAPGRPEASTLVERLFAENHAERMPPPDAAKTLDDGERELLRRWISAGAAYSEHWAFVPPSAGSSRGSIDAFVGDRIAEEGLEFAPQADRPTLLRRLSFDLTGLPPSVAEREAFLSDQEPGAYERLVERTLASPHYAEHMARQWLDLARYADTSGYQYDKERAQWAWRDWVIAAFEANMPFDQFTVEQLAGDLLPNASLDQIVATGFNRNHPITIEGGVVDEEYRVEYVMDRVSTFGTTWLGLTIECARCHDHKFDPVSQEDFYGLYAFFDRVPERGLNGFDPKVEVMARGARAQLAELDGSIAALEEAHRVTDAELAAWVEDLRSAGGWQPLPAAGQGVAVPEGWTALRTTDPAPELVAELVTPGAEPIEGRYVRVSLTGPGRYLGLAEVQVFSGGANVALAGTARQSSTGYGGTPERAIDGRTDPLWASGTITHTNQEADPWWEVDLGHALPVERVALFNRDEPCCVDRWNDLRVELLDEERAVVWSKQTEQKGGAQLELRVGGPRGVALEPYGRLQLAAAPVTGAGRLRVRGGGALEVSHDPRWLEWRALPAQLRDGLERPWSAAERDALAAHAFERLDSRATIRAELDVLREERDAVAAAGQTSVLVMRDQPGVRVTRVLERGQYDQGRDEVSPAVPAVLGALAPDLPRDRLGLARWLTAPEHPLTARVAVNRLWAQCFGRGIVATPDNFGLQGTWPSHPALLDWLASEFVTGGWDVQAMLRRIVLSRAYRQSSRGPEDPRAERLFARGARFRLDAESIRDQALAISGLLDRAIGGPSVYPYQPAGLWQEINNRPGYSRAYPEPAAGQLHRRSVYTYWKRTLPPPTMQLFDAPNREVCTAYRSRTNTPLQALALLHDPQFVEAARALAGRVLRKGGADDARLTFAFQLCTQRAPREDELAQLRGLLAEERARLKGDPDAARATLAVGLAPRDETLPVVEHAAWFGVARVLLNLSEVVTRG